MFAKHRNAQSLWIPNDAYRSLSGTQTRQLKSDPLMISSCLCDRMYPSDLTRPETG